MKKLSLVLTALSAFAAVLLWGPSRAAAQELRVRFTNPICQDYPYPQPMQTNSGAVLKGKPKNIYCTRADLPFNLNRPDGVYAEISKMLQDPAVSSVTLATMTFSHRELAAQLCGLEAKKVDVRIVMDAGADRKAADELKKCGAELIFAGAKGRLFHNKFILFDYRPESHRVPALIFSSANFSNPGLTINHEMWGFYQPVQTSAVIEQHRCLVESLGRFPPGGPDFARDFNACRAMVGQKINRPEPLQFFSIPVDSRKMVDQLTAGLRSSQTILMASNRFSFTPVMQSLSQRPTGSAPMRAVFDDDLYWMGVKKDPNAQGEERGEDSFGVDHLRIADLEKMGGQVKFSETSAGAAQKMHCKYTIFDRLIIAGSGNYTTAGMTKNFENIYLFLDPQVYQSFRRHFEALWQGGTGRAEMPRMNVEPAAKTR